MEVIMRIALINENSQAAKNSIIEKALRKVVEPMGFEVRNYGMYAADDEAQLTYVQNSTQINDGNAISLPFALGFGWGGDLNLEYIFEKLFCEPSGGGYPKERAVPEQRNKKILDGVKLVTYKTMEEILPALDQELVKGAFAGKNFKEYFFADATDENLKALVKGIIG